MTIGLPFKNWQVCHTDYCRQGRCTISAISKRHEMCLWQEQMLIGSWGKESTEKKSPSCPSHWNKWSCQNSSANQAQSKMTCTTSLSPGWKMHESTRKWWLTDELMKYVIVIWGRFLMCNPWEEFKGNSLLTQGFPRCYNPKDIICTNAVLGLMTYLYVFSS